jgi:uncharacterized protein (UPF0147 family)
MAMIELLANVREADAVPIFDRLMRDESADKNVRDAAKRALATLRTPPSPAEQNPNAKNQESSRGKTV